MEQQEKDILFTAYKRMVLRNLETGLLRQHISDFDFYAFGEYPKFFLEVLEAAQEKYNTDGMVGKFYELNSRMIKDKIFAKEVFKRLVAYDDFKVMKETFGEDLFTQDIELIKEVAIRLGGKMMHSLGFKTIDKNIELRDALYDLPDFSLTWFKLPPPEDDNLIKKILNKDDLSYIILTENQKLNKEYALIAMSSVRERYDNTKIYDEMPSNLKLDKDIALLASKKGIVSQPGKAFHHEGVLRALLDLNMEKQTNSRVNWDKITSIDTRAFEKPKNIEVLLEWLTENNKKIKYDNVAYGAIYKVLKSISKFNPYVKERFEDNKKLWNLGNIGETKYQMNSFFQNYFLDNIPQMHQEILHYVRAFELSESLNKSNEKPKKIKI